MKRLFIALKVEPGEPLLMMISSLRTGLRMDTIKWTSPGNIHVTLAFLGDTEEEMINPLCSVLKELCTGFGEFQLILKGSGVFRNFNDPRIIWTGIETSEKLFRLYGIVMNGLNSIKLKIEKRSFNPHLTLGRIKHINDKTGLKKLIEQYQNSEFQLIPVSEVILYESILTRSGPLYKQVASFKL